MDEIKEAFLRVKKDMISIKKELENLKKELNSLKLASTQNTEKTAISTDTSTLRQEIEGLKPQNLGISIGNEGVPTDRQTNRQTDVSTQKKPKYTFQQATEILESLDNIKKEIRLKFKRLTSQEMLIFSTLYQLEQTQQEVTYKDISLKLKLTESSIRDYISRLINKGIPVDKVKKNNKQIILKINQDLTKIASLDTILQLREL